LWGEKVQLSQSKGESQCADLSEGLSTKSREKAEKAAREGRIVLISEDPEIAVFLGKDEDYISIPPIYCSCKDFSLNVIIRRRRASCYHLLSACISRERGTMRKYIVRDPLELATVLREVLIGGRAETVRKSIYTRESSKELKNRGDAFLGEKKEEENST